MKKTLLSLSIIAGLIPVAQAGVILSDSFTYPDGPIISAPASPWTAHSGSGSMMVSNNMLLVSRLRGEDVNAPLVGAPYLSSDSNAKVYSKFTMVISNDLPTVAGTYFAHFRGTNTGAATDFGARIFVTLSNTVTHAAVPAGKYRVSVGNGAASSDNNLLGQIDQDLDTNVVYTVVTRFIPSTGVATIWVNPAAESDIGATATDPGNGSAPNPFNVFTYAFRQNAGEGTVWRLVGGRSHASGRPEAGPSVATEGSPGCVSGRAEMVGEPTVTLKVVVESLKPSLTFTVMIAVPCKAAAGVTVMVRLAPLPPKTMFGLPFGTRMVSEEVAVTVSEPAAVSASSTVKESGPAEELAAIFCGGIDEMVGEVFVPAMSLNAVPIFRLST